MLNVAIIPARGGSKGVHRKNLKKINGLSLIGRAINSAKVVGVDKVIVTTDDIQIKKEALKFGAEVPFLRSSILSNDDAISENVIRDVIKKVETYYSKKINLIIFLEPTSPFRNKNHVNKAMEKMLEGKHRSVVSVCQLERKPENIFVKSSKLSKYIIEPQIKFNKRQDMKHLCRLNSAIYITTRDHFMVHNKLIEDPIGYIEMSQETSLNIDTLLDLKFARTISKNIDNLNTSD